MTGKVEQKSRNGRIIAREYRQRPAGMAFNTIPGGLPLLHYFDPHILADQFLSMLGSERFQKLQLGLEPTPDEADIDAWARQTTSLFLHGYLKDKPHDPDNKSIIP